jgi:hypothetical protein
MMPITNEMLDAQWITRKCVQEIHTWESSQRTVSF